MSIELERDYGGQYLLIAAKPTDAPTEPCLPLENDLADMNLRVAEFKLGVASSIEAWRSFILGAKARGQKTVIWSALSKAVAFLTTLQIGDAIQYATDINPQRHGKFLPITGQEIVPPAISGGIPTRPRDPDEPHLCDGGPTRVEQDEVEVEGVARRRSPEHPNIA